jgi:SOS response regulatory protein OraA/RecX
MAVWGKRRKPQRPPRDREEAEKRAYNSACRALSRRPRGETELANWLLEREHAPEVVATTIERIRDLGYLDDVEVAASVARDAERRRLGSQRAARTLAQRGIANEDSTDALDTLREGDLVRARAVLERRYPEGVPEDPRERQRALRRLVTRGYPYGIARKAVGLDRDVDFD